MPLSTRFLACALCFLLGAPFNNLGAAVWAQNVPNLSADALALPVPVQSTSAGGARALRLVDFEGRALTGTLSEPKWEARGGGLFFTREWGGTRNIWRAFPDASDNSRYPRWRALPVTQFAAPLFAFGACPLQGDRAILMLSNAANPRVAPQVTFFDLRSRALQALTAEPSGVLSVAPAPEGNNFAYVASTGSGAPRGQSADHAVWIQSLSGGPQTRKRVALNSWRPTWQTATSLLVEGVLNQSIFRLPALGQEGVATQIATGTQVTASRNGSTLVMKGKAADSGPLYLLAGDGSGLRALSSTEGAQSPALSGDGRFVAFVAPWESEAEPTLWILPLQQIGAAENALLALQTTPSATQESEPLESAQGQAALSAEVRQPRVAAPIAQIRSVQTAANGALAIWGDAIGTDASATIEIGQGASPRRWEARRVGIPRDPTRPLLLWNPPPSARGVWTIRLTVSNPAGAAQNLFSVKLPLAPRKSPRVVPPIGSLPKGGPLPSAPLPDLPAPPLPSPAPLPPLLPAPPRELPSDSLPNIPASPSSAVQPPSAGGDFSAPRPQVGQPGARDAATFNVSNTLAQMKAGQSVEVTFWALNRGSRPWEVSATRDGMVRLVTRWVRFDNGNRNGWTYQTMKTPVPPGSRTRWSFNLVAPSQPGRYKVIYALQRVGPGWAAPEYNAAQETWPGDFEAIAFAVNVKP